MTDLRAVWDWVTRAEAPNVPLTVAQSEHWADKTMVNFFQEKEEDAAGRAAASLPSPQPFVAPKRFTSR